ncbi:MAG: TIGR01244 family sulfur transferase [Pseudomonadota bacterium]
MPDFRAVTDAFAVSPQIFPSDVDAAAARGFTLIINNRPDGESPGQPSGAQIQAAARAAGLAYAYIPVSGRPTPEQVEQVRAATAGPGKALAFCRSGTRSIVTWALGQAAAGAMSREHLVSLGAAAGYDLAGLPPARR